MDLLNPLLSELSYPRVRPSPDNSWIPRGLPRLPRRSSDLTLYFHLTMRQAIGTVSVRLILLLLGRSYGTVQSLGRPDADQRLSCAHGRDRREGQENQTSGHLDAAGPVRRCAGGRPRSEEHT